MTISQTFQPPEAPPSRVRTDNDSEVRSAIRRFLLMGLVSVIIVATPAALWIRIVSERYAVDSAYDVTQRLADYAIAPTITHDLMAGDPTALQHLDDRLASWLDNGAVEEILVWDASGRVFYSDVGSHIGELLDVTAPAQNLLVGGVDAMVVPADGEVRHEMHAGTPELVGVLVRVVTTDDQPLIVEAYYDAALVSQHHTGILLSVLPPVLLALLALQLAQLIPAVRLAQRIQGHRLAQQSLIQRSLDASTVERKRIAQRLHDDVIQELSGLAYSLESQEYHGPAEQRPLFRQARMLLQENVTRLREMTTALYPSDLKELGLIEALRLLRGPLATNSINVRMDLRETPVDSVQAALLYRFAREALANVAKHAQASLVEVSLGVDDGRIFLQIQDDGEGFDPRAGSPAGHLGMTIMRDAIADASGTLEVRSEKSRGTTLTATLPLSAGRN